MRKACTIQEIDEYLLNQIKYEERERVVKEEKDKILKEAQHRSERELRELLTEAQIREVEWYKRENEILRTENEVLHRAIDDYERLISLINRPASGHGCTSTN